MATLTTIYWLCFGIGMVYVIVAGAMGAISGGLEGSADSGLDVDSDAGFDIDTDLDVELDSELDAGGMEGGFDAEHGADLDSGHAPAHAGHEIGNAADFPGFSLLSPLSIAGFMFAFGAAGLVTRHYELAALPGLALAGVGGAGMMLLMWLVIGKLLYGMQGSSEGRQQDMIGLEAEVLTPVEGDRSGEIAYILSGVRYTAPARLDSAGRANKRETVRIKRMKDNVVYVVQKKKLLG